MMDYVRAKEIDGSEWVNAEAFDEAMATLKEVDAALCDGFENREGRMRGRKVLIRIREIVAAIAKAEETA